MKKWIVLSVTLLMVSIIAVSPSYAKKAPKKGKKTEQADTTKKAAKPKQSNYDKLIKKAGCVTMKSNFITTHKIGDKLYFEYPTKYFGRELLIGSKTTETSEPEVAIVGYMPNDPLHVRLEMQDSVVLMKQINASVSYDPNDKAMGKAISKNYMDVTIKKYPIKAYTPDSSAVVIDVTELFIGDSKSLAPIALDDGMVQISAKAKSDLSAITGVKAFDDNLSVVSDMSYTYTVKMFIFVVGSGTFSAKLTRTVLLLPEKKAHPRVGDSRVGTFLVGKANMSTSIDDKIQLYTVAQRWRVEPKDTAAYLRGELVEPVKPVVYYIDDAFPELWREPIKKGVLRWNSAFEKIGFKNVMQVKDFPKDDPSFDPDNLKYTCVRYLPINVENAMGPSWVDPGTGEILNASVLIYNDVANLINKWRFVQTSQIDTRVRASKMPDDVMLESIEYVVAHEVGHTLGLMHNMAASAAFPVDSLRSATFTQKYGTTPSIMDYARFNYIAQPGDKGVKLTPPSLGCYDDYIIKWLYKPVFNAKTQKEEEKILESWVDEKAGDPKYRYGHQQIMSRYDPSSLEEDLGDDPIKAAEYGIKNLKYILPNLSQWINDDESASRRKQMYNTIANTYYRYMRNVIMNVGGIYLTQVKDGTPGAMFKPVSKEVQKKSMRWVVNEIRNSNWIDDKALTSKFGLALNMSSNLKNVATKALLNASDNVVLSAHVSNNPYSIQEYFNDLYNAVFESAIVGRKLTEGDKILQRLTIVKLRSVAQGQYNRVKITLDNPEESIDVVPQESLAYLPSVDDIIAYGLDPTGRVERYASDLRALEQKYGEGFVASKTPLNSFGYSWGYGFQQPIKIDNIDEATGLYLAMLEKARILIKSRLSTVHADDKDHYMGILYYLESVKSKY